MHTIEIPHKKIRINLPSCWEDCTTDQAQHILQLALAVMAGELSMADFRIKIFLQLTGMKLGFSYYVKEKLKRNNELNARIYQLSEQLCGWIFTRTESETYELDYKTIINHFPTFAQQQGPADLLADITLGEFKTALSIADQYFESKEDPALATELLNLFIAMIYRPKNIHGNRTPFHLHHPEPELFAKVPEWQKQCALIWFTYCVKCLQTEDLTINGIEVNLSVLFPQSTGAARTSQRVNLGWTGILMEIAESGTFGTARSAAQTPLYDILLFLLKKHQDNKTQTKK